MTLINDPHFTPVEAALLTETMPLWLWDPANARIVWANKASLVYSGARSLDDLRRLHFRAGDGFVRQLAELAASDLGAEGRDATIRFGGGGRGRAFRFRCRNAVAGNGTGGLLIGLLGEAPDSVPDTRAATAKPNGRSAPPATAAAATAAAPTAAGPTAPPAAEPAPDRHAADRRDPPPSAPTPGEGGPGDGYRQQISGLARPGSEAKPARQPLIIDPAAAGGGYGVETVDEEDLLTLQEIARMINGATAAPAHRPAIATRGEPRPTGHAAADGGRPPKSGDSLPPPASAAGERPQPVVAPPPPPERNYFLEAVPAAIAIAMGGRLMRANEAFLYAFGFGTESELRKAGGLAALFPESRNGVLAAADTDVRKPPRSGRINALVVSRSGRRRRMPIAFRSVSTGREPVQVIVVLEDVLSRDAANAAASDSRRPEPAAARMVGDDSLNFLARVSHEIRTPLNSIIGFSELAMDESLGQTDIRVLRGYAEDVHTSAMHALSLVNDLLDITRIMAGRPELDLAPLDANEVVAAAVASMKPQIEQKRIGLSSDLADSLPLVVADRRSLLQILLNLVANAVKFTAPGGRIALASRHVPREGVTLSVSDSGIGMSRDDIALALQPYRQLEKSLAAAGGRDKGSGLGLPLSKALAEAHGAEFVIDSTPGLGTRVDLRFPPECLARRT